MTRSLSRSLALLLACLPALAGAEKLDDALRRCAGQSDPGQRLACLDAVVSSLPQLEADRLGLTADIERKREPPALQQKKDETLSARISGLRQAPGGEWIFTLDDQQVWIQAEANSSVQFAVGDAIRIEHGALSSLWLIADQHRRVRVKRVR